jgi:hypothetical protein
LDIASDIFRATSYFQSQHCHTSCSCSGSGTGSCPRPHPNVQLQARNKCNREEQYESNPDYSPQCDLAVSTTVFTLYLRTTPRHPRIPDSAVQEVSQLSHTYHTESALDERKLWLVCICTHLDLYIRRIFEDGKQKISSLSLSLSVDFRFLMRASTRSSLLLFSPLLMRVLSGEMPAGVEGGQQISNCGI